MTIDTKRQHLETLSARAARGEISRRQFTQLAAMLCWPARRWRCARRGAYAQAKELVLVNWGGDAITAYDEAYGQAVHQGHRHHRQDGRLRARPKARSPRSSRAASRPGISSTSIRSRPSRSASRACSSRSTTPSSTRRRCAPGFGWEYAASTYFFSYIIAYDSSKFGDKRADRHGRLLRREEVPRQALALQMGRRHVGSRAARRRRRAGQALPARPQARA